MGRRFHVHRVNKYFNRFFSTCSRGLFPVRSNHAFTFAIETTCAASCAFTRTFNFVADPNVASAKSCRRNSAMAITAASCTSWTR